MSEPCHAAHEALMQFMYQAPIGLVQATLDGEITMINPMSAQLLMPLAPAGNLVNLFDVLHPLAPQLHVQAAAAAYPGGVVCDGLRLSVGAAGGTGPQGQEATTLSLRLLRLDEHTLMCSLTDITGAVLQERQRLAAGVRDAGRIDSLTRMPTRAVVLERIEQALRRARGDPGHRFAVLFINGDRFNRVNVTLGAAAGDEVLLLMAARINGAVRHCDAIGLNNEGDSTAARLGVDEFVVVLESVRSADGAAVAAQRLVDALGTPYMIGAAPVHSTASIGVVLGDGGSADAEALLQDASLAMREAKRGGGGRHCVFAPQMRERAWRRANLEGDLRLALQEGQLFVVYQPITDLADGSAAGVEALVRWQHPLRGVVSPIEFIEIAEETGLIGPLGAYVLRSACRQFTLWQRELGARAPRLLSVNLSRAQLVEPTLVAEVHQVLKDCDMPAGCLQLEITESLAAENPLIRGRLHELKALGVMLALDDFGTGYSSLSSLHQWPVDVIKIDRSFVSQVASSAHHRVLVEATVRVARSLGMRTVAEGVETAEQAAVLVALQCDKGQGYLYARPLGAQAATQWLAAQAPAPALQLGTAVLSRAEAGERLLQHLDPSSLAVALFDPEERLVYANPSFRQLHWRGLDGTPNWEDIMRTAHRRREGVSIETADINGWIAGVRKRYRQTPRRVFESNLCDGRWMRVCEETAPDGWQLSVSTDVTLLKVNEAELRQARDTALVASITDPLTGLPNRRHVFARLQALMAEAIELRLPLTVAVIDLDKFKLINDQHGHAMGDSVLLAFTQCVGGALRPRDVLGRIGGEEFLLVLMNTGRAGAERVLGEARAALRRQAIVPQVPALQLDFSAGVTVACAADTSDALWQRADRGLYAAKAAGRGCDTFVEAPDEAAALMDRLRGNPEHGGLLHPL